jgi:hypothetical protein
MPRLDPVSIRGQGIKQPASLRAVVRCSTVNGTGQGVGHEGRSPIMSGLIDLHRRTRH